MEILVIMQHQHVDLFGDLFEVRDAKWKNEEKNIHVSTLKSMI